MDTRSPAYAERLERLANARWKRWLDVQAPYRRHLQRLDLGRTLDLGCGLGRHLVALPPGSVGIDHNPHAVEAARARGVDAYLPDAFRASPRVAERFDSLLCAHVAEHMRRDEAASLLSEWMGWLRPGGRLVLIAPQEAGFRADPTHVDFLDLDDLAALAAQLGCQVERAYSFPLPRFAGQLFRHNESVVIGRLG